MNDHTTGTSSSALTHTTHAGHKRSAGEGSCFCGGNGGSNSTEDRTMGSGNSNVVMEGCMPCVPSALRRHPVSSTLNSSSIDDDAMTDGDVLRVSDLNNLSLQDREKAMEDVHGVSAVMEIPSDPAFLQKALRDLDLKLAKIRDKKAYDMASFHYPRYTKDPEFRLIFLRIVDFDVGLAAHRMVVFFEKKLELFGKAHLGTKLCLHHLDPDVQNGVKQGCFQFFPTRVRDQSGRPVYFQMTSKCGRTDKLTLIKSFFYTILAGVHEMDARDHSRGIVLVIHFVNVTDTPQDFLQFILMGTRAAKSLPVKIAAFHICFDNKQLQSAVSLVQLTVSSPVRVRFRWHHGSYLECLYALLPFGIDLSIFPLDAAENLDREKFQYMLELREQIEQAYHSEAVLSPSNKSVLLGRGRPFQVHAGNVVLSKLVDRFRSEFSVASKSTKNDIVDKIVLTVRQNGGNFLKLADDGMSWVETTSEEEIRGKVRRVFRPKAGER